MIESDTYSEVYEILSYMDKSTVMKIPSEILEKIKEKRNKFYISNIDPNDIFNSQNVKKQTIDVLVCLDVNFWMTDEKKKKLKEKYYRKNTLQQEMYNADNIFKKSKNNEYKNAVEEVLIVEYEEKNFWQKICANLKKMFKKI